MSKEIVEARKQQVRKSYILLRQDLVELSTTNPLPEEIPEQARQFIEFVERLLANHEWWLNAPKWFPLIRIEQDRIEQELKRRDLTDAERRKYELLFREGHTKEGMIKRLSRSIGFIKNNIEDL